MKLTLESQGRVKMAEKQLHKYVDISPKQLQLAKKKNEHKKKAKFVTVKKILGR